MSKCKICPACNTKNDPRSMECVSCSYDLMSTPIVDPDIASVSEKEIERIIADPPKTELVRICYCGELNPPQLRKCQRCHEDISDIVAVPKSQDLGPRYQLEQIDNSYIYSIPCGTIIIGRENCMQECLATKSFVSRTHAKLTSEDGKLYIENLSKTNYTYVNNKKIPEGRIELNVGDEIGLGGIAIEGKRQDQAAFFIVGKQL